jgi:pilus assembly protein Flp/PilA
MVRFVVAKFRRLLGRKEEGASLVEYGLLVALIAVACIAAITFLAGGIENVFNYIGAKLNSST